MLCLLFAPGRAWAESPTWPQTPTPLDTLSFQVGPVTVDQFSQDAPFEPESSLAPEDSGTVAASAIAAGAEGTTESTWVTESLAQLEQTVAAQASRPTPIVQAESSVMPPSSTHSSDLQLIEAPTVSEDLFQTSIAQSPDLAQATSTPSQSEQWHVTLVPYVYVPLFISGSVNFKGTENFTNSFSGNSGASGNIDNSRDFEFTPSQIVTALKDSLNFAFLGAVEAWSPNYTLGFLTNVDYLSVSSTDTLDRSVRRPGFTDFVPTQLNSALNTQLWGVDLAASYRFYDPAKVNPEGVHTEFDLGPFVFDVQGGLNLTVVNAQLGLNTNLGGDGEFTSSDTILSPLLGGRFRWNASPKFAVTASGSVSGFGISGLMQYNFLAGVDWIFSGNTSLGLGYRLAFLDYYQRAGDYDLNANQNGPYLSFGFRF